MPTTYRIGLESDANKAIGGIPKLHYLDICSQGRGQVIRLFCIDAEIAFDDVRYPEDEFLVHKAGIITQMNPTAKVPIVELNSNILTQSYAILRHFARLLGKYDGSTSEEKYHSDAMCDIAIDWRTRFVDALLSPNSAIELPKYRQATGKNFLRAIETHLNSNPLSSSGPYVLGSKISYADFVIYQMCHDEELSKNYRQGLKKYPRLTELVDAVEGRDKVKRFLESAEYKG